MDRMMLTFLLITMTWASAMTQCIVDSNNVIRFNFQDHEYLIVKENNNWVAAAACAVEQGGYLVEIDSQAEQDSVYNAILAANIDPLATVAPDGGGGSYLWIGANDMATNGVWLWDGDNDGVGTQFWQGQANGVPVDGLYNNWGMEPDFQDAVGIAITDWPLGVASEWNDVFSTNLLYYVVEKDEIISSSEEMPLSESDVNVYPNPARDELFIDLDLDEWTNNTRIEIRDLCGRLMLQRNEARIKGQGMNIQSLNAGQFIIRIHNGSKQVVKLFHKVK